MWRHDTEVLAQLDGVLASVILDDFFDVGEIALKSAPEVITLCTDFGIPNMDHVAIDCWPSEDFDLGMLPWSPICLIHGKSFAVRA